MYIFATLFFIHIPVNTNKLFVRVRERVTNKHKKKYELKTSTINVFLKQTKYDSLQTATFVHRYFERVASKNASSSQAYLDLGNSSPPNFRTLFMLRCIRILFVTVMIAGNMNLCTGAKPYNRNLLGRVQKNLDYLGPARTNIDWREGVKLMKLSTLINNFKNTFQPLFVSYHSPGRFISGWS